MAAYGMRQAPIGPHMQVQEKLFRNGQAAWRDAEHLMQRDWTEIEKLAFPDCSFEWKSLTDGTYSLVMKSKDPPCIPDFLRSDPRTLKVSQLHLSVNRIGRIPAGISIFSEVTDVKLDRNKLKSLTPEFTQLKKIKNLDLGNNIFKTFPAEIKEFGDLEVLRFSVNQVEEIPAGVFLRLPKLKNLRIGSNKLKSLPEDLVSLEKLEYLKISSNKFTTFPPQLLQLPSIRQVCLSANKITEVPLEFFDKPLELFQAEDNPLQKPPQEVCNRGIEAIKSYCRQINESLENIVDKRLKLMLLGETGAGKTSLCHSLKACISVLADPDLRTVGIDAHDITEGDVTFLTWDFAGQQDYPVTHPVFITKDALVLLVVNLEKYEPGNVESYRRHVGVWVENIAMRVPNAVVLVVGTHLDKIGQQDADAKLQHILGRIVEDEDDRLGNISVRIAELKQKVEGGDLTPEEAETRLEQPRKKVVRLRVWPVGISLSSSEGLLGFDKLKEELMKIVTDQEYFVQASSPEEESSPDKGRSISAFKLRQKIHSSIQVFEPGQSQLETTNAALQAEQTLAEDVQEELPKAVRKAEDVQLQQAETDRRVLQNKIQERIQVGFYGNLSSDSDDGGPSRWHGRRHRAVHYNVGPAVILHTSYINVQCQLKGMYRHREGWRNWNGTLAALTVEHLQGFKDGKTVDLHPRTTAIIGPNSSGKTTLARACLLFATLSYEMSSTSSCTQLISNSVITDIFSLSDIRDFWYRGNTEKPVTIIGRDTDGNELQFRINYVNGGTLVRVDKMATEKAVKSEPRFVPSHRPVLAVVNNVNSDAYKPQVPKKVTVPSFPVVRLDHTQVFSMLCELQQNPTYWNLFKVMLITVRPGCQIRLISGARQRGQKVIMVREGALDIPLQICDSGLLQIVAVLVFVLHSVKHFCAYIPFSSGSGDKPIATVLLDNVHVGSFLGCGILSSLSKCLTHTINCQTVVTTLWMEIAQECEKMVFVQCPNSSHDLGDPPSLVWPSVGSFAHPVIAAAFNNLGATYRGLGDHSKAVSYYEQALQMMQSIYGEHTAHPDIASSLYNLGTVWSSLGDHQKATSYFEQSLDMMKKYHGNTASLDIAVLLDILGDAWKNLGHVKKSLTYHEDSVQMKKIIYDQDPGCLKTAMSFSVTHFH